MEALFSPEVQLAISATTVAVLWLVVWNQRSADLRPNQRRLLTGGAAVASVGLLIVLVSYVTGS